MKKLTFILSALFIFVSFNSAEAQIWKKIQKKAERKLEEKAEKKIDDVLEGKKKDKKTDSKKEEQKNENKKTPNSGSKTPETTSTSNSDTKKLEIWRNYKFIPGEKVIFYDDQKFEEVGEFPSRWDLLKGGAEIARFNNEKVIITTDEYFNTITPLFDKENYLSDEFTIEFDIYIEGSDSSNFWTETIMTLVESNGKKAEIELRIGKTTSGYLKSTDFPLESVPVGKLNDWHHVAISYHKGKTKMYYDDKRIANIPRLGITPNSFKFGFRAYASGKGKTLNTAAKNIRIAHGGGQMYKRIVADGKYTTNGILFDSGKAIVKSQSMGILNKVVTVMNENPDWSFLIIGHTDSDGDDVSNLSLSKSRAEAVKQTLVKLGIKADRLLTDGKGESEPINPNTSPEEKANNRRVEFIKQ